MNERFYSIWVALAFGAFLAFWQNARADMSAIMTSTEASEQASEQITASGSSSSPQGISRASVVDVEGHKKGSVGVSAFSMVNGPAVDSMSTSAPSAAQPFTGVTSRHMLRMDYGLSNRLSIAPTMDVTENFYDTRQGRFIFNDPSIRLSIADVNSARLGVARFQASVWISAYAPTSAMSQSLHEQGAFSGAYIPRVHFKGSRFSITGVASAKANAMENSSQTGEIVPVQLVGSVQGNYKVSRLVTGFLMNHVNGTLGPKVALVSTGLAADNFRRRKLAESNSLVTDGIMFGTSFQLTKSVCLSPRMDWQLDQSIGTTTLGVNAIFHVI